jgi:hypothetical protein
MYQKKKKVIMNTLLKMVNINIEYILYSIISLLLLNMLSPLRGCLAFVCLVLIVQWTEQT